MFNLKQTLYEGIEANKTANMSIFKKISIVKYKINCFLKVSNKVKFKIINQLFLLK